MSDDDPHNPVDLFADSAAPNCQRCLMPMEPDDGAWSWQCPDCGAVQA
ncbi:hypothetical protein GCM10027515_31850 [Schumannella luteola]|uniref:Putative RNA-binding Zn-ribbon protein involved in translation (DUF1610 family) n=1 Tax=Schumannella luteola TaxID=472059 RepID=A0A852YCL0_9MICO|nr:hypothetical protein [Schumannella luteola]NYG99014.1 putative RNA-binding Zn-ribbon protein involved in translation (DUF1610 family) [Schumannella luteola]